MTHKSVISIDVGSSNTKVAVGEFKNNCVYIEKLFLIETPSGSQLDGRLILAEGRADKLRQNIVQALSEHKIKYKDAIFTIQSTSVIRRELEVPNVKPHEMESMIRYEIEQYLPIDLSEYVIEYKVLGEQKDSKSKILIAALPKTIAEDYLNLFSSTSLEPKVLDINSNAVSKLFSLKQEINNTSYDLDKTVAIIDLGSSNINVSILSKGLFQFSRLIKAGGNELTTAIADTFNITIDEAEKKKKLEADIASIETDHASEDLNKIIQNIVLAWIDGIQRVFQFYKTRNANNNIDVIYLSGGTSNLPGITEYIAEAMNMPTKQIKTLSGVIIDKQKDNISLEYYLNSIGAIIRK